MNSLLSLRYPLIYRAVITITLLASVLAIYSPDWMNSYGRVFAVALIIAIGVPHGAADYLIFKYSKKNRSINQKSAFYISYILLVLASVLCWYLFPNVAISIFIVVSSYHLGQSNLYYLSLSKSKLLQSLIYGCWGIFVIFAPILSNPEEVTRICNKFLGNSWIISLLNQDYLLVGVVLLNLLIFSLLKQQRYLSRQVYLKEVFNLVVLAILFYSAPLIVSFGVYFAFWHSLGSTLDQIRFIRQYDSKFSLKIFYWQTAPLTLLSVFLFVIAGLILTEFNYYSPSATAIAGLFFVSLAAITLPHALIRDGLYQSQYATHLF